MEKLIYQTAPTVTLATNRFTNVPIILQVDETPMISIVREVGIGFTTEIPIFHPDGTYLAKVNGTRIYPTEDGKKAGLIMRHPEGITVCEMNGQTLFEIIHQPGDAFKTHAELYTPKGYFIKCTDLPMPQLSNGGKALQFGGLTMSDCSFLNVRVGIWIKSDGSFAMGCA